VQNSPLRRITFRDTCASNECPDLSLICTVKHRWNTHASCMLRHLELRPAVHALCGRRDFIRFLLSVPQWKMLEQMEETLKVSIFILQLGTFSSPVASTSWQECEIDANRYSLFQFYIEATEMVSLAERPLIHHVIPLIDQLHSRLTDLCDNVAIHMAIRHAASNALVVLNKYYSRTDECVMYRVAMSKSIIINSNVFF